MTVLHTIRCFSLECGLTTVNFYLGCEQRKNLRRSQCLTNNAVYILLDVASVSSGAELYNVPFGAADQLNTMAVVESFKATSLTP
jgi:hypothetical protein